MLSLHLLGEHGLRREGRDVSASIHYRKGWGLLGYLAVERGRRHSREHLAQLLWPQLAAAAARTNLRQVVADLNRAFQAHGAPELLESTREAIALHTRPQVAIDLVALDALASLGDGPVEGPRLRELTADARALGGRLLTELSLPDCEEFEEWLQLARTRVASATEAALERLCRAQEASGQLLEAVATAQRIAAMDEWNERHQRLLMRLLAATGRHGEALAVFQVLRASLRAELGSEPERATRELHASIEAAVPARTNATAPGRGGLGTRGWISAVYCELQPCPGEPADAAAVRMARAVQLLQAEDGWILSSSESAVMACFYGEPGPGGVSRSAKHAAVAALSVRDALGAGAAMALCSGMARSESLAGGMAVLGNPGEWARRLCARAGPGHIVLCPTLFRPLHGLFELTGLGDVLLPGVSDPVRLWALGGRLAGGTERDLLPAPADPSARAWAMADADMNTLRLPDAGGRADLPPPAWLAVQEGTARGKRVAVHHEPLVIGRSSDSDLQIPHRAVSRHHCAIWLDGDRYRIRDLGSTNRTRVNDAAVQETELHDGDRIVLGDSVLQFGRQADPPTLQMRREPVTA